VTAKLSKLFYERLGEQIADELVGWFNAVDATYRSDLRELNELNFARFDAKLEQRFAQFELKVEQRLAAFELKVEQRIAQSELKMEQRISALEQRMAALEATMERRFAEQWRWLFAAWASLMIPIIGLWFRG
jgi:CRP-like cAMP-binding protein